MMSWLLHKFMQMMLLMFSPCSLRALPGAPEQVRHTILDAVCIPWLFKQLPQAVVRDAEIFTAFAITGDVRQGLLYCLSECHSQIYHRDPPLRFL